jgi:hypothetical protein
MSKDKISAPNNVGPEPTEALGIVDLITGKITDHKPGHDQSSPQAAQDQAELPPSEPNAAPRASLADRLRHDLTGKGDPK